MRRTLLVSIASLVASLSFGFGQSPTLVREHFGPSAGARLGKEVAALGDLDGDGFEDYGAASVNLTTPNGAASGQVRIYSGRTGAILHVIDGPQASAHLGVSMCAAGDFDNDGDADFALGWNDSINNFSGGIIVYDGATATVLRSTTGGGGLGTQLAFYGDRDGDGRDEILCGEPYFDGAAGNDCGRIRILERGILFGFASLLTVEGGQSGELMGLRVGRLARDLDGDGASEIVVAAPYFRNVVAEEIGRVRIVNSSDGTFAQTILGGTATAHLGIELCTGSDYNGDLHADFAAMEQSGALKIFNGTSTTPIQILSGNYVAEAFGMALSFVDDVTGDGRAELAVGQFSYDNIIDNGGRVWLYSSNSAVSFMHIDGNTYQGFFGRSLAAVDADGDGRRELLIGSDGEDAPGFLGSPAVGSATLWDLSGGLASSLVSALHASKVGRAGDVDGDGVGDYIVGAVQTQVPSATSHVVRVYSGATRAQILNIDRQGVIGLHGFSSDGIGDITGDGVPDLAVGDPGHLGTSTENGVVRLYSGANGAHLSARLISGSGNEQLGWSLAGIGDVNGDSVPDVLVGAPGHDRILGIVGGVLNVAFDAGRVAVHSGLDGSLIWSVSTTETGARLGQAVASVADLDGDGVREALCGVPFRNGANTDDGGIEVRSGATGVLLYSIAGASNEHLGAALAAAGDLDSDGIEDFVAGAPEFDSFLSYTNNGRARAYSGASGAVIWSNLGNASGQQLGSAVASIGDVDGDGVGDLGIGMPGVDLPASTTVGAVRVVSGASGATIRTHFGQTSNGRFGASLAGPGDIDQNGTGDLVVGVEYGSLPVPQPLVYVLLSSGFAGLDLYGIGTPGCQGPISLYGNAPPTVGNSIFALVSDPGQPAIFGNLVVGGLAARSDAGLDSFGIGLLMHVDLIGQPIFSITPVASGANGTAVIPAAVGAIPSLAGFRFESQVIWYFPGCLPATYGYASSNGLEVKVLP